MWTPIDAVFLVIVMLLIAWFALAALAKKKDE